MIIRNGKTIITDSDTKHLEINGFKIEGLGIIHKGYIHFETIDTSKYPYEKGYKQEVKRKLTKDKTIRFQNVTLDLSRLYGMETV